MNLDLNEEEYETLCTALHQYATQCMKFAQHWTFKMREPGATTETYPSIEKVQEAEIFGRRAVDLKNKIIGTKGK